MGRRIVFALMLALGFPVIVQAACTEEELNFGKDKALVFRMHALQGQGKLTEYMQLGSEVGRDFSTFYAEYQKDRSRGQPYLDRMCAIIDRVIVLADDLLAGGDGLGKNTPWMSHRPEEMLKAAEAFGAYCQSPGECGTPEGKEIMENLELLPKVLVGGAEPAKLVDENYEHIQRFLAKEREKTSQPQQKHRLNPNEQSDRGLWMTFVPVLSGMPVATCIFHPERPAADRELCPCGRAAIGHPGGENDQA